MEYLGLNESCRHLRDLEFEFVIDYKCLPIDSRNLFSLVSLPKLQLFQNPAPGITTRAPPVYHITPIL